MEDSRWCRIAGTGDNGLRSTDLLFAFHRSTGVDIQREPIDIKSLYNMNLSIQKAYLICFYDIWSPFCFSSIHPSRHAKKQCKKNVFFTPIFWLFFESSTNPFQRATTMARLQPPCSQIIRVLTEANPAISVTATKQTIIRP